MIDTHLKFVLQPRDPRRKTNVWAVDSDDGYALGVVRWWSRWRRYVFEPNAGCVFDPVCLRTLADFAERATYVHKVNRRPMTRLEYAARFP